MANGNCRPSDTTPTTPTQTTNLNTMGQHTHHLPKHLGNWPCHIDDGPDQYDRVTVIYEANGATHELRLDAGILTPIRPDEPSTQYALDDRCDIWQHVPEQPDYGPEISLWRPVHSGPALDWPTLWDRHGPIRPLVEVPAVTVPFDLAVAQDRVLVNWMANPVVIRASLVGAFCDLDPDEAEQFGAALLDAARKARAHLAADVPWEGVVRGGIQYGEHVTEADRPLATGGIIRAGTFVKGPPADPAKPFWDGAFVTGDRFSHLPGEGDQP